MKEPGKNKKKKEHSKWLNKTGLPCSLCLCMLHEPQQISPCHVPWERKRYTCIAMTKVLRKIDTFAWYLLLIKIDKCVTRDSNQGWHKTNNWRCNCLDDAIPT